jgi:hypothetical protein
VSQIDLLLVVDNSRSMADKQALLSMVAPDLLSELLNPACLDGGGNPVPAAMQPGPTGACPAGTQRDFPPVYDVHVGMLSSSLGTFGADGCPDTTTFSCPNNATNTSNDDHGHLVTRVDPCAPGNVPTYQSEGFLAWDPQMKLNPPGETQLGSLSSPGLVKSLHDLVVGDGQSGCGFESQNESWYRFLVDPTPYQSISLVNNQVQLSGIDTALLQQRSDFLRPDSLLVVVVVTDETDTSIKEYSSYPLFGAPELHLPHPRQDCYTKGPTDPCCASCGQVTPAGCLPDPMCMSSPSYTQADENTSLRAFGLISHKQRYGIEFFYQPSRYVTGLTASTVPNVNDVQVPNPILVGGRPPQRVFYAAMVGVPWQLVARQKNGVPDLVWGVSALDPKAVGGFKTYDELNLQDPDGNVFWDDIAGDPEKYVPALSPYMQESTTPRTGVDPITGIATSPPGSPNGTNDLNGHEWSIPTPPGDIEYACVFPIFPPIDCSVPGAVCDCSGPSAATNPLCDPNPQDNMNTTLQTRAKAYPGIKHLAIARGMGTQGIVGSICAYQVDDTHQPNYAYRPFVKTIVDRLKPAIRGM